MDAELYRVLMKQAQRGEHIRRLVSMEEWGAVTALIDEMIKESDTVQGITTDKEWWKRQAKVDVLKELQGRFVSLSNESQAALEELKNPYGDS